MLRVPQHHPGHKHRGRRSCTISERPTSSFAPPLLATSHPPLATALLTPIIPAHPGHSSVSSIILAHTQIQGGGGCFFTFHCRLSTVGCELSFPPNSFVFSRCSYHCIIYMNNNIVGAPTFCKWLSTGATTLLSLSRSLARHSPLSPMQTVACALSFPAPTFLFLHARSVRCFLCSKEWHSLKAHSSKPRRTNHEL
jgi:hypothetical protein